MRAPSSQCAELQHCIRAPHSPVGAAACPVPDHGLAGTDDPQIQEHSRPADHIDQQPLQAHHCHDGCAICSYWLCLGQRLYVGERTSPVYAPDQALLPEWRSGRSTICLLELQPQCIHVLLPRCCRLRLEDWCQARAMEGRPWRRSVALCPLLGSDRISP